MKKYISVLLMMMAVSMSVTQFSFAQTATTYSDITSGLFCQNVTSPLAQGTRDYRVSYLQSLLREKYAYSVSSTGYYGPVTDKVVRSLQRTMGIAFPSGAVGPITLSKLRSVWCDNVTNPSNPITINFSPNFSQNNNVTLNWSTQNANSCTLNGENVAVSGSKVVTVYSETVYKIRCTNSQNAQLEKILTVTPSVTNSAPVINFYTSPSNNLVFGQNVSLIWYVTNANSCTLNGSSVGVSGVQNMTVPASPVSYTLSCNGNGGSSSKTITLNQSTTSGQDYLNVNSSAYNTGDNMVITWKAPVSYSGEVQGVILDLIKDGNVVGTINRLQGPSSAIQNTYTFTVPKSLRDTRNDAITCTTINGENLCGNLITSGQYKVRATYFTPYNACFGFCVQVPNTKVLGTYESSTFTINSSIASQYQNINLSISPVNATVNYTQQVNFVVTVTNNGTSTVSYPSGSSSCPSDLKLEINNQDFYILTNQSNRACTMDYQTVNLNPGQSYTRTFAGILNGTMQSGTYALKATLVDGNKNIINTATTNLTVTR